MDAAVAVNGGRLLTTRRNGLKAPHTEQYSRIIGSGQVRPGGGQSTVWRHTSAAHP